jgi:hypothetical protein
VRISVRVIQDCSLPIADEQTAVVEIEVKTVVQAVRTDKAGAQDVNGFSLNCSWTVAKLSRWSVTFLGRRPTLMVVDIAANGMTKEPGSSVDGKVIAVVPTVQSQSSPPSDDFVGLSVLSARPTKPPRKPCVVGHILLA